jgi:hypothetical protein
MVGDAKPAASQREQASSGRRAFLTGFAGRSVALRKNAAQRLWQNDDAFS